MSSTFPRLRVVLPLAGLLSLAPVVLLGCSEQQEGQRCDLDNGNADCADGLVCTSKQTLGTKSDMCCPSSGKSGSPDCTPSLGGTTTTSSGSGGAGGQGGASGTGGQGGSGGQAGAGGA